MAREEGVPPRQGGWEYLFSTGSRVARSRKRVSLGQTPSAYHDFEREFEIGLFCDETKPGQLFLTLDIAGPAATIGEVITGGVLTATPIFRTRLEGSRFEDGSGYTRIIMPMPKERTLDLLTKVDTLSLDFSVVPPYQPMSAHTRIADHRETLIFAANNCMNRA